MKHIVTLLAPGVSLVHWMLEGSNQYDRFTTVTERDDGKILHVRGWAWPPLTQEEYYALRDQEFPRARFVSWERLRVNGTFKPVLIALKPPK